MVRVEVILSQIHEHETAIKQLKQIIEAREYFLAELRKQL